ncbi:MAG TPA: hypothetical protein PLM53_12355 [Spirochaetota bacterium]|nr:hypothetical protein [Spirochaetota bacterium]HPC42799.1 hypothetical protein [Spirochaetota bacterium]HPL15965.1 hypothetical protein [Spirochaetota bacterium]HQF08998.1 hypothetical protein [Spirochaetota bacterium]HQH97886.1 hypothetical protein [Spirochaetota bacterium]
MKRILQTVLLTTLFSFIPLTSAYPWIFVDMSQAPIVPIQGVLTTIQELDNVIWKNFRNYPAAFALTNVGGYPVGDALIGDFPHMYFGVSFTLGCSNMKYYDESIPREKSIYPAYAPNPVLNFGFGLKGGFDVLFKLMIFTDAIYRPPLNQKSAKMGKFNFYSAGFKLRKNLVGKKDVLPNLLGFGGFTIAAGGDFMDGITGINGSYDYTLQNIYVGGSYRDVLFTAYYNFNLKWQMIGANAQATAYINFLWIFDLYAGFGFALTWGRIKLDGSGVGPITSTTLGSLGYITARCEYSKKPKPFMGLFIAGLEINIWILKITLETDVNITNGKDINLQLGTRFQF